jgi:hypothetical protein
MYKLNVKNMSYNNVKKTLGIFQESYVEGEFPPPPKLRRSYKAVCPLCAGKSSTMIRFERRSVCWTCQVLVGRQALAKKINVMRQQRESATVDVMMVLLYTGLNLPFLQNKIIDYIVS